MILNTKRNCVDLIFRVIPKTISVILISSFKNKKKHFFDYVV